eukprot:COSAG02_NODE_12007_length_1614_cov_1.994059_2_plen_22_part_01
MPTKCQSAEKNSDINMYLNVCK